MVSKQKYDQYLEELLAKDKDDENLKWMTKKSFWTSEGSTVCGFLLMFFGLSFIGGSVQLKSASAILIGIAVGICLIIISIFSFRMGFRMMDKISAAKEYYEKYKNIIIDYLLSDVQYELNQSEYVEEQIFLDSQLFSNEFNSYNGEDKLAFNITYKEGNDGNCKLVISDVKTSSGKNNGIIRKGIFGYIELPKEFNCKLYINSDCVNFKEKLEVVELENMEFNNLFKIMSDNQVEARYILTPKVMESLFNSTSLIDELKISFVGNKIYFWFKNLQLFNMDFIRNGDVTTLFSGFYAPLYVCLTLIEEVRKNKKIFKM